MDGQDADAVDVGALDGLAAQRGVPFAQESVHIRRFLSDIVQHVVVERAEIGTLVLHPLQVEDTVKAFHQVVEWQEQQRGVEVLRQCTVNLSAVGLLQECPCNHVVRMRQTPQRMDNHLDGRRRIQAEGLVADHAHLWHRGHQVVGYHGDIGVRAQQDGNLPGCDALRQQVRDMFHQQVQCLLLVVLAREQLDIHASLVGLGCRPFLLHVVIGRHLLLTGCLCEEGVVETDDVGRRTVVGIHRQHLQSLTGILELVPDIGQQAPVATAPAVDALLHVAYYQVRRALMAHRFLQQYLEVLPLHGRGILKLVNHDMFQVGANLLKHKGRVAVLDQFVEQLLRV